MAIYHFRAQVLSRGSGRSVIAAAAYRHRTQMMDERIGTSHSYERAQDLAHEELSLPADAPRWVRSLVEGRTVAQSSEAFWNAVEAHEKRVDGQLAREIVVALPQELTREENIALLREFVASSFTDRGMVADWVFHDKDGNPHAHIMTTLRPLTEEGFGLKKVPVLDDAGEPVRQNGKIVYELWAGDKDQLKAWRAEWAQTANRHLAMAGHQVQIDHRSYKDQGLELVGTEHLGPAANAIRVKLGAADKSRYVGAIRERNAEVIGRDPASVIRLITAEKSAFDERDIARAVFRFTDDAETFERIRAGVMTSPELVTLVPAITDPQTGQEVSRPLYSSREMVEIEKRMAVDASLLRITPTHGVKEVFVERALGRRSFLAEEQREAVQHITGRERIAAVVGFAGAGKSTMLDAARDAWEAEGYRVFGAALAGKAAEELEKSSGIKGRTLASWELAWSKGQDQLKKGDVFVIDEAGMVPSKQLARVLSEVKERGAKVVLIGDAKQLQPIEAGAAFRAITERVGYVELSGIRRQKEEWARQASVDFARGRVGQALDAYRAHGAVAFEQTRDEAKAAIVSDWLAERGRGSSLVLAHTNKDVYELNQGIREGLKAAGELGDGERFMTARGAREFAPGDRVIFLKNDRTLGVKNGMLGNVAEAGNGRLSVELDGGRRVEIDQAVYNNVDHGYAATVHKSQGSTVDRTYVLATPGMDQHLTYVGMSRHRESAVLYAAREDFKDYRTLAERLGRSGAKTTTLDYEDQAAFAERRGFESKRTIAPAFAAFVEKQRAWIADQTARLEGLWDRAQEAWGRMARRGVAEAKEQGLQAPEASHQPTAAAAAREPLFAAVTTFARTVEEEAREQVRTRPAYAERLAEIRTTAARIFRNPDEAAARIEAAILKSGQGERVAAAITAEPQRAGELRGSDRLLDGLTARQERQEALGAVRGLGASIEQLGKAYELGLRNAIEEETRRRQRMSVPVENLSSAARTALEHLHQARERGGEVYNTARIQLELRPELATEIRRFADSLTRRFGDDASLRSREAERFVKREEREALSSNRALIRSAMRYQAEQKSGQAINLGRKQQNGIDNAR
jgi:Ti-type conjugative transfer relaxase TraA